MSIVGNGGDGRLIPWINRGTSEPGLPSDARRRVTLKQRRRLGELAGLRETGDLAHVDLRERVHDCAFLTGVDTGGMPGERTAC